MPDPDTTDGPEDTNGQAVEDEPEGWRGYVRSAVLIVVVGGVAAVIFFGYDYLRGL